MEAAVYGFIGVIVGAIVGAGGQVLAGWVQIKAVRKDEKRRAERADLLALQNSAAEFLQAAWDWHQEFYGPSSPDARGAALARWRGANLEMDVRRVRVLDGAVRTVASAIYEKVWAAIESETDSAKATNDLEAAEKQVTALNDAIGTLLQTTAGP